MASPSTLMQARRLITSSNLPLPGDRASEPGAEPGVDVTVDVLKSQPILGGTLMRSRVATNKKLPTNNDGFGSIPLDDVPGVGIVLPGGLNMYYLDVAPNTEGTMHRTTSTDYLVILEGTLSLITPPPEPYTVDGGKPTYGELVETLCQSGEVVLQRGMMHALSNRTDRWVRLLAIVLASEPNRVPIQPRRPDVQEEEDVRILDDAWLA
ncbi:putative cupin domain containing protein [Eutypa lata UCREL1]|uniref:Putative cupin domain containing protein n=1 Tax=Eutypa lata (strain UCR-EL1) TaxID=1287681 RepID=M7SLA2_EUTLA|nr:putative cupin domain containing protein [Eutypa lata UCREL1]